MRAHWGSSLGFILATAGSAIGLGNIWRFPYLIAQNNGGSFLLIYLLCIILLGYFLLTSKLAFGRIAQTNFLDGFQKVAPKQISPLWKQIGGSLIILNIFLVCSIYAIVIGWTLSYVFVAGQNLFSTNIAVNQELFQSLTNSYHKQFFWGLLCILISSLVLIKGVKGGIEKAALYLMPVLFGLLIFMAFRIFLLPNTEKGFSYLFQINWNALGFDTDGFHPHQLAHITLLALGQAIYSLSLGLGVCFIYGSYLKPDLDIKRAGLWIVFLDTCVALLASCIIVPAVFSFGLDINQGPGLSFVTLPFAFEQVKGGRFLMFLFFVSLFVAALTSLISIYEPLINLITEKLNWKRKRATFCVAGINVFTSMIILASFTKKVNLKVIGRDLFDWIDYITGAYTLGLAVLVFCLFMGWEIAPQIVENLKIKNKFWAKYIVFVLKWLAPITLVVLFFTAW